jgi:hypothetical protein
METQETIKMSILIQQEHDIWVVQGLEHDIAAQGKTLKEAIQSFHCVLAGQIHLDMENQREPLQGFEQAPDEYWAKFKEALPLGKPENEKAPFTLPPMFNPMAHPEMRIFA